MIAIPKICVNLIVAAVLVLNKTKVSIKFININLLLETCSILPECKNYEMIRVIGSVSVLLFAFNFQIKNKIITGYG